MKNSTNEFVCLSSTRARSSQALHRELRCCRFLSLALSRWFNLKYSRFFFLFTKIKIVNQIICSAAFSIAAFKQMKMMWKKRKERNWWMVFGWVACFVAERCRFIIIVRLLNQTKSSNLATTTLYACFSYLARRTTSISSTDNFCFFVCCICNCCNALKWFFEWFSSYFFLCCARAFACWFVVRRNRADRWFICYGKVCDSFFSLVVLDLLILLLLLIRNWNIMQKRQVFVWCGVLLVVCYT